MIHRICPSAVHLTGPRTQRSRWSVAWDKLALHPVMSLPLFLLVMYALFVFAIGFGGIFQDFFEQTVQALISGILQRLPAQSPIWLNHVITAFGRGMALTASFIPVLMGLFVGLGALEQSGYMARVAYIAENLTRWIGLPGKAFIPLLVGFGCNVPAVMGTRILHNPRDRILTIMMLPFMSCGARLAIYALFVSVFFAESGYQCIFMLYLIGILVAVFTVLIFKHAWFRGVPSGLTTDILDTSLPAYRWPEWLGIIRQSAHRVKKFVRKAGMMIIPCCLVLGSIGELKTLTGVDIEWIGRKITPIFRPLGIEEDNWPATVGLLTGMLAKEVLVGSLGALYPTDNDNDIDIREPSSWTEPFVLADALKEAAGSIVQNAQSFGEKIRHPFELSLKANKMKPEAQRFMVSSFGSSIAAFSYLLFVLLYFPCISVVVVIAKELNRYWAALSVLWSTGLAYVVSVIFYQVFQVTGIHGTQALEYIGMALLLLFTMILGVYLLGWVWGKQRPHRLRGKSIFVRLVNE